MISFLKNPSRPGNFASSGAPRKITDVPGFVAYETGIHPVDPVRDMQLPSGAELEPAGPSAVSRVDVRPSRFVSSHAERVQLHDQRYTQHVSDTFCQFIVWQHVIRQQHQFTFRVRVRDLRYRPVQGSEVTR
jgi:hypothetical protein